jgi:hypothetical protein
MRVRVFAAVTLIVASVLAGCARHPAEAPPPATAVIHAPYPYTKPLTSLGTKFGALPTPVQNTVRAEVGMTEISDVIKESTSEKVYYVIYFKDSKNFPPLYIAPDGSVLNPDLTVAVAAPHDSSGGLSGGPATKVTIKDLPAPVLRSLEERVPADAVDSIKKETWGDHVVYSVLFKDDAHLPPLHLVADGRVLEHVLTVVPKAP